ncbi:MAG: hypothetical protein N2039_15175 [Gemmataceae bacterium]|nr:hypothetical protein [Gemmataceae bacterium]
MPSRWIVGLVLCTAFAIPGNVRADAPPSLVVKLKSIDGLLEDVKYLAELAGAGEEIQQINELLNSFKSDQGLGGIDTSKPWGLYGSLSDDVQNSPLLVLLPIKDEKAFLEFLGNFEIRPEKDKEGVYTIENIPNAPLPVTLYFRFANQYCYIAINEKSNLAKDKLPDPKKALPADDSVISISARIAELPDLAKQLLVTNLENMLGELKEKQSDDEAESVTKLKEKVADFLTARVQMLLTDGETLTLRLAMDSKKDDMFVEAAFKAKSGSALAKEMIEAGKSLLKSGKIDAAMTMRGPDTNGHYTAMIGLRVQDGMGIPVLSLNASMSRAVGLSKADPETAKMIEIAKDVFGKDPAGTDLISISGEMTDTLRLRIGMKAKLIKFFAKSAEAGIGGGEDK